MRYDDALLDSLRLIGDPQADALVARVVERGDAPLVNALLRNVVGNDQAVPAALPDDVEAWLARTDDLPPGTDVDQLDRAAAFFRENSLQMAFILSTASLVGCYAAAKGARVLTFTYRLAQNPYRRAAETSQFVLQVLAPDGLEPHGRGIRVVQKIRLMHAAIRHLIRATGRFPEEELGAPVCQEDLLLAWLTFSYDVITGLGILGIDVSTREAEDYLATWRVVGTLLGIEPAVMPRSMAEAAELRAAIERRQYAPSEEGVLLTRALLEMHDRLIPGEAFDGLMPALVRRLVGDRTADIAGVPRSHWDTLVRHYRLLGRYMEALDKGTGSLGNLVDGMALRMLTRLSISATGYERAGYEIPTSLRTAWTERGVVSD